MSEDDADSFGMLGMFGDPEDDLESSDDGTESAPPVELEYNTDPRRPRFVGYDKVARQFQSGSDVVVMRASAGERQDVPSRLDPWASFLSQSNLSPSLDTLNPYRICDDKVQTHN